jgi:hypothetical protein
MDAVEQFTNALMGELDLPIQLDTEMLLEIARDVAHGVARPAAPITTAVVGAALASGRDPQEIKAAVARAIEGHRAN